MTLTEEETEALYKFFMRNGYISYEHDPLVILLIRKLHDHLEERGLVDD